VHGARNATGVVRPRRRAGVAAADFDPLVGAGAVARGRRHIIDRHLDRRAAVEAKSAIAGRKIDVAAVRSAARVVMIARRTRQLFESTGVRRPHP